MLLIVMKPGVTAVSGIRVDAAELRDDTTELTVRTFIDSHLFFVSLQGLTITAEVRYSPKMGRHYLNVMFIPSARFKSQTEGLCGVMDDDPSNDLRGPNGEQYNDPIQFADSCKYGS